MYMCMYTQTHAHTHIQTDTRNSLPSSSFMTRCTLMIALTRAHIVLVYPFSFSASKSERGALRSTPACSCAFVYARVYVCARVCSRMTLMRWCVWMHLAWLFWVWNLACFWYVCVLHVYIRVHMLGYVFSLHVLIHIRKHSDMCVCMRPIYTYMLYIYTYMRYIYSCMRYIYT